jgi:hypothetical protein
MVSRPYFKFSEGGEMAGEPLEPTGPPGGGDDGPKKKLKRACLRDCVIVNYITI